MKKFKVATKDFGEVDCTIAICKSPNPMLVFFAYFPFYTGKMLIDYRRPYMRDRAYNGYTQLDAELAVARLGAAVIRDIESN